MLGKQIGILLVILSVMGHSLTAQDISVVQHHINVLTSAELNGRAFVDDGDAKAAKYIKRELESYGLNMFGSSFYQTFTFPLNTFPGKMQIALNNNLLTPVTQYVIAPESKGRKGIFPIHYLPQVADTNDAIFDSIAKLDYSGVFVVADFPHRNIQVANSFNAAGIILPKESIYWWLSTANRELETTVLLMIDTLLNDKPSSIKVDFESKYVTKHKSQNVIAWVEGTTQPDSMLVFAAHYDHLGCMGKENVFRGANDNASGTAMVLWLAEYFSKPENKPECSIVFMFFAGEESGLLGSRYFVNHPLIDLGKVKALMNLDMVGSGSEGLTLVNGRNNDKIVNKIEAINAKNAYFSNVQIRGESCNSDHCFFHKAGVPSVFIYTRGQECKAYHNLNDIPENVPLSKFWELRSLLIEWAEAN